MPAEGELLILSWAGGEPRLTFRVDEAISAPAALPLLEDLLPQARPVPFGVEERCAADPGAGTLKLRCRPGVAPAGLIVRFDGRYPQGGALAGRVEASGSAGFAAQFVCTGAEAEAPLPIGRGSETLSFPARSCAKRAELVIVAPGEGGTLELGPITLVPTRSIGELRGGGAWAWQPELWKKGGDALIAAAAARGLSRLYVTLEIEGRQVRHREALARFVAAAGERGIAIEAVEGDPQMVLEGGLASAVDRARAIARYQRSAGRGARLAGIQYDIEPYVLAEWGLAPADHDGWAAAVRALTRAVGEPIHLVLPFWVGNEQAGERFLEKIEGSVSGVTAMAYRTDPASLTSAAEPLLYWGVATGKPVRLALEMGPVGEEEEEIFVHAATGRIAILGPAEAPKALLLARQGAVPGAVMFASRGSSRAVPDRISFLGDEARMLTTAERLGPVFAAWSSFAGFAFHGIKWPQPLPPG
jgi:hypothetical protein